MATTTVETAPTLDETAVQGLAAAMRGTLIQRGDPGYDEARTIYNAMIDKHPALIAQCANVADVIAAVNFARDNDIIVAIRGGGHNGPGLGLVDDGLVIDLSLMNGVRVDPEARTARVEGGALLGDLHHATNAFGLATPSGIISTTGVGGITLGGGIGHLTRQLGLAIDNLLEADVVLADGSFVTASETENPDLFWALRGGGGNFGVVTSFLFKLHPIPNLTAGPMLWPLERSAEVLRWYRDFITQAPDDLNGFFAFLTVPSTWRPSRRSCGTRRCAAWSGPTPGIHRTRSSRRSAPNSDRRLSTGSVPSPTRRSTACSTASTQRATSGIGRRTSSRRSRTKRSTSMSSMPRRSRPGSRRCISTRSMVSRAGWPKTPPPGTTGTPSGAWSWSESAPTRPTTRT